MHNNNSQIDDVALFEKWAENHLGQGYPLTKEEGSYEHPVTRWAFIAWKAGRKGNRDGRSAFNAPMTEASSMPHPIAAAVLLDEIPVAPPVDSEEKIRKLLTDAQFDNEFGGGEIDGGLQPGLVDWVSLTRQIIQVVRAVENK